MGGTSLATLAGTVELKAPEKFPALNHRLAKEEMGKLGAQLRDGKITPLQFRIGMERELKGSVTAGYRFQVGHKLTEADLGRVNGILERQGERLASFVTDIGDVEAGDWIPARAELYGGAAREAENEGRFEATDDDATLEWTGPDGEESCEECAALIGTSRTVAEWRDSGEAPGMMTCLDHCRCELA